MSALALPASRYHEPDEAFLSARRVAEGLGVTLSELARLTGVARNTLSAVGGRKIDAALSPIVRILALASEMAGARRGRRSGSSTNPFRALRARPRLIWWRRSGPTP